MRKLLMTALATGAFLTGPAFAQQWDHAPDEPTGYNQFYHDEVAAPDLAARYGYRAGYDDGVSDKAKGHSFRPTEDSNFKNVPDIHDTGRNRQQVKDRYREAYVHGYEQGFGPHS